MHYIRQKPGGLSGVETNRAPKKDDGILAGFVVPCTRLFPALAAGVADPGPKF